MLEPPLLYPFLDALTETKQRPIGKVRQQPNAHAVTSKILIHHQAFRVKSAAVPLGLGDAIAS